MIKTRLSELAEQRGHSLYSLAKNMGVAASTLTKLENRESQSVSFKVMEAAMRVLNCGLDDLFIIDPDAPLLKLPKPYKRRSVGKPPQKKAKAKK